MSKRIIAQNTTVIMGADVHTSKHVVTFKAHPDIQKTVQMAATPEAWRALLKRFPGCEIHVIYESGPHGYNLYDLLTGMNGCNDQAVFAYVAPPAHIPKAASRAVKTDTRDSISLIQAFETRSFRPVPVPCRAQREERELVRTRKRLKDQSVSLKNQIKSMAAFHGVALPAGKSWTKAWRARLTQNMAATDTTGFLRRAFKAQIDALEHIEQAVAELGVQLVQIYQNGHSAQVAQRVRTHKGIGLPSAVLIATEVADFTAFDNSAAFASYVGLVPREFSSGERVRRGSITRVGNSRLRWIFTECAWVWIRCDPKARAIYEKIKCRRGARRAITAMARRLAVRVYHLAKTGAQLEQAA